MEAPIFKGSRSTQSGPCLAGVFSLCFRLLFTFWVTPENELAKRYLRYSHLFYRRILRVPKRLTPSPCSQHFKILCIGPVQYGSQIFPANPGAKASAYGRRVGHSRGVVAAGSRHGSRG